MEGRRDEKAVPVYTYMYGKPARFFGRFVVAWGRWALGRVGDAATNCATGLCEHVIMKDGFTRIMGPLQLLTIKFQSVILSDGG